MERNYDDVFEAQQVLEAQTITGDGTEKNGSGVDLGNCRNGVLLVLAGVFESATTATLQLQTSADDGDKDAWADVLASDETILTAADQAVHEYELLYLRRYVRLQYTVTNGKNAILGACVVGWAAPVRPIA